MIVYIRFIEGPVLGVLHGGWKERIEGKNGSKHPVILRVVHIISAKYIALAGRAQGYVFFSLEKIQNTAQESHSQ